MKMDCSTPIQRKSPIQRSSLSEHKSRGVYRNASFTKTSSSTHSFTPDKACTQLDQRAREIAAQEIMRNKIMIWTSDRALASKIMRERSDKTLTMPKLVDLLKKDEILMSVAPRNPKTPILTNPKTASKYQTLTRVLLEDLVGAREWHKEVLLLTKAIQDPCVVGPTLYEDRKRKIADICRRNVVQHTVAVELEQFLLICESPRKNPQPAPASQEQDFFDNNTQEDYDLSPISKSYTNSQ